MPSDIQNSTRIARAKANQPNPIMKRCRTKLTSRRCPCTPWEFDQGMAWNWCEPKIRFGNMRCGWMLMGCCTTQFSPRKFRASWIEACQSHWLNLSTQRLQKKEGNSTSPTLTIEVLFAVATVSVRGVGLNAGAAPSISAAVDSRSLWYVLTM